jgi:hypothetical protein
VAGKTAPDCIPTVWRPSTFWCYEVRDQVAIIASALLSVATSLYGGIAFYGRFTLGHQRLSALGVDLKHLKKVVEVVATVFLIDKVIRLHRRKDEITVKTLWRDLPFDQDMDRDVVAELKTQLDNEKGVVAELKTQLDNEKGVIAELKTQLDNLSLFVLAHVQAGDTIVQQQPGGSSANDNGSHPAGVPSSNAVPAPGLLQPPTICPPLNGVAVHEGRHALVEAPREGRTRSPSPGAHTSQSTLSLSCAMLKLMCSPVMVIIFFAAHKNNERTAAGSSNAQVTSKLGKTFVPTLAGRYGSQLMTQKVVALQPIVPPVPPRSRSKSRARAGDDASSSSRVDPVQAASASAGDARAPLDPAAQPSLGAAAASAGGGASRHRVRRSVEQQPSRKSRGDSPPPFALALEKARLDQIDWC